MFALGWRLGLLFTVLAVALPHAAEAAPRTFTVNSTADAVDRLSGDGSCATSAHACTLRAAVQEANAHPGADTIRLPAGTFALALPTFAEDTSATGDLDIVDSVTIAGQGATATVVAGGQPPSGAPADQRGLDRLFEVHRGAGDVTLSGLTLREGYSEEAGGALQNWSPGTVRIEQVDVLDSNTAGSGGGVNNADPSLYPCALCPSVPPMTIPGGTIEIVGSTFSGNAASGYGAAVNNQSTGTVELTDSDVTLNPGAMVPDPSQVIDPVDPDPVRLLPGPGVYEPHASALANEAEGGAAGTLRLVDSEVSENFSPGDGAGILNAGDGTVVLERTDVTDNTTEADGAGIHTVGGRLTVTGGEISGNLAHGNGGGVVAGGDLSALGLRSRVRITGTGLSGNEAWASGGALHNDGDAELLLADSDVSGNHAHDEGGGLSSNGRTSITIRDSEFTGNRAHGEGAGANVSSERPGTIENTDFAENESGEPLEEAGGGGLYTAGGPLTIKGGTIADNRATGPGAGLAIHNLGDVLVQGTVVHGNRSPLEGGGIENGGSRVTFERVHVHGNRSGTEGGGIHNSSSGEFTVIDTTIRDNRAQSGGGFTNASDSTLVIRRSLIYRNVARKVFNPETPDEGGYGGGLYSVSDGGGLMENTTISSNTANIRGGGMFHDADAAFRIVNSTFWRNGAPFGGGISVVESDFVPSIPPQPHPLTLRNTIVAGSTQGGSCDAMLTSDGGNLDSGTGCAFQGTRDRGNSNPKLDALADNGGHTLSHAPRGDSLAVDWALRPCVEVDQRGVTRPQHRSCDAGAIEYDGPLGTPDDTAPDTEYLTGPSQNSLETVAFTFTGSDDTTSEADMAYECRLVEHELTEPPEVVAPWEPVDPELLFVSCQSGWEYELIEDGLWTFEVRAIDRAGNVDPTPAMYTFDGTDTSPPQTLIAEKPPAETTSRAATFTFDGIDNRTPGEWLEYECRLDSRDPDLWVECFNPTSFSNLTTGLHTLEVRSTDAGDMTDPSPARYTWRVVEPTNCDEANVVLTAAADAWVDESAPAETFLFDTELDVASGAENARALVRFALPDADAGCELESATLRLHAGSSTAERELQALPLAAAFRESTVNWLNQPAARSDASAATTESGDGYREWDVKAQIDVAEHGWLIRDAHEGDLEAGGDQTFTSREQPQDPPEITLPQLVLRYVDDDSTPPAPPAEPVGPPKVLGCGDVVRESTTLATSLTDCPREGLVIGAPDIVLDLGDHTVDGIDYLIEPTGNEEGMPAGIRNSGHSNVVIRNGTVQQFGYGVLLTAGTTHTTIDGVDMFRNAMAGLELFDADDGRNGNTVRNSQIAGNEVGVQFMGGTEHAVLEGNEISGNLGEQLLIMGGGFNRVEDNTFHGIPSDPALDSDGGVLLEGTTDNDLIDNTVRDTGDAAIIIAEGSHRNRVLRGEYYRNGDAGVVIDGSDRNVVIGATAHQQSDGGIVVGEAHHTVLRDNDVRFNPAGVEASNSNHLVLEGNTASESLQSGFELSDGIGLRIVGNTAHRTGANGIMLESGVFDAAGAPIGGALLEDNRTDENGQSGIVVSEGGHRLRLNRAYNNTAWGVDAAETSVDGGNNRASGNGQPEQCSGISCITGETVPLVGPDLTAPETTIDTRPSDPTGQTSATFTFSSTDARTPATAMVHECRLDPGPDPLPEPPDIEPPGPGELPDTPQDGEGWFECVAPIHFDDLDEGEHRFEVRALDQGDNRDLTPAVYEWTIEPAPPGEDTTPDTLAPETRLVALPADPTTETTATFRFLGSDDRTPGERIRFECALDGGAYAPCSSPHVLTVAVGTHTFAVRALDATGNADPEPATHTWTVNGPPPDTTPPDTRIDSGPDRTTVRTDASFSFTVDDPTATLECVLNGVAIEDCATPLELTGLAVRAHELVVTARDAAGNADPSPARYAWTVTAQPVPENVACGQVLTHSTLVLNDLHDCQFNGLVIGAPNITVDLDGHSIDGVGLGAGIRNDGHDNVTIRNGRTVEFDYGVALNPNTTHNIVEDMTVESHQEAGLALGLPPQPDPANPAPPEPFPTDAKVFDNVLRDNTVNASKLGIHLANGTARTLVTRTALAANQGDAIWLENAHDNRVTHNTVGGSSGHGIALEGATRNAVADNELEGNSGGILVGATTTGVVGVPSEYNVVERNTLEETGSLELVDSNDNTLADNTVARSTEAGAQLEFARDNVLRANVVRGNKGGIHLKGASGNRLEDNDASNSDGTGIALESQSFSNTLIGNESSGNVGDGIYVGDEAPAGSGSVIEGNATHSNIGYGIVVTKPSHVIKGNSANDNGSWGIYASEGSNGQMNVDAGGNRAVGNNGPLDPLTLRPLQCHIVNCAGGDTPSSDPIAPETTLIETDAGASSTFRFTGSDNASAVTFQCSLDAGPFGPCESPRTFSVGAGEHTFAVRAVDAVGNVDLTPAAHTWTVEAQPGDRAPETAIDSGPDATTAATTATFTYSADEPGASFECALDAGAFVPCALIGGAGDSVTYAGLAVGTHTFRVRATDTSGNTDQTPATRAWRITAAPVEAEVSCGEFITQSTKLRNDLLDCPGNGLIVGAADITLDLDGHVIDGVGIEAGVLNGGHDNVTVTGGQIHGFDHGVQLNPGTAANILTGLRVEANQEAGIVLSDADQATVRGNDVRGNGYGIALFSGTGGATVRANEVLSNSDAGVYVEHSRGNLIAGNEIEGSAGAGVAMIGGGDHVVSENVLTLNAEGVSVGEELLPSDDNRIEHNTIEASGGAGVLVADSSGTILTYNVVRESNGAGAALDLARETVVRGNDLRGNAGGIALSETTGSRIEFNDAGGARGTGIALESGSVGNELIQNITNGSSGEGIAVEDSAIGGVGNLVERNLADANGGDGIMVAGAGHTITANRASLNGGWGIYAPAGATDGGGNVAAGNLEPDQCLGVVCALGEVPGAPETHIISAPPETSNSRNASFTYFGSDDVTPITELVFECRLDGGVWDDCEYPHEVMNLQPGEHTLEIRALDLNELADPTPAKHTWTYEPLPANDPPEAFVDLGPEASTWSPAALFTFHSDEPDVTFECRVDTHPYEPCGFEGAAYMSRGGFEWELEETEVGEHTFRVRATDFEGNVGAPAIYRWSLLGVATEFLSGPGFTPGSEGEPASGGETASSDATIDFVANVADATYECSLDLAPFAPCAPPVTYTGLGLGDHELRVVATDAEGVTELEAAVYEWEVIEVTDTVAPDTSIERAPETGTSNTLFEFTGTDNLATSAQLEYECRVDSTNALDWEACESPFNLLDRYTYGDLQMAPGAHVFEVRAVDEFENADPSPDRHEWTSVADGSAPGTAFLSGPTGKVGDGDATFEFNGADNATPELSLVYECSLDGAPYEECTSPHDVTVEPGVHELRVRAVDLAGNADTTPAVRTWELVAPPVATILTGPSAVDATERAIFTFSADQPDATFECSMDGATFEPCTSPHAAWVVEDGDRRFEVRGVSATTTAAGDPIVGEAAFYEWEAVLGADAARPDTEITSGPLSSTPDLFATFAFRGSDNRTPPELLDFECSLDGEVFGGCESPEEYTALARGEHELLVRAVDQAGNLDTTPARYEWTVSPPPVPTVLSGPGEVSESPSATFTFTSDVPGSTFECWLDGPKGPCTSPVTYNGLSGGEHIFAVRATGPNGISSGEWADYEFRIADITPPLTTITAAPAETTVDPRAEFAYTSNEAGVTFLCGLDGAGLTVCPSPKVFEHLAPGEHRFEVQAIAPPLLDPMGNPMQVDWEPVSTFHEWTIVDTADPETSIDFHPRATSTSVNAVFGVSSDDPTAAFECSLDGAAFASCESPAAYTELARTAHTFAVRAIDAAGNVDQTPATFEWEIGAVGPANTPVGTNVVVSIPMPDGPENGSVTFESVSAAGTTAIDALGGGATLPDGYSHSGARFYDVTSTADFGGDATVCLAYDPAAYSTNAIRLLAFDGSEWLDITLRNDPAGEVCGLAEDFTGFAVASAHAGVAPIVSILSGPPNPSTSGTATFEFFADLGNTMTTCSIDGEPFVACTSPVTYTHLETGGHDLQIQAVGPFGLPSATPTVYEWEVVLGPDTTGPDTTITRGPGAQTGSFTSIFEFTGSDDQTPALELDFECSVDGGPFEGCSVPEEVEVLTPGEHEFRVRAVDEAGNVDPDPARRVWNVVDVSAPDTSLDSGPNSETSETSATFTFTGEEENGTPVNEFECSLDGHEFSACSTPHTVSGLGGGAHNLQVRAVDPDGNADPTPDIYEWLVIGPPDTTPPDTTIHSHPGAESGPDVRFGFLASEAGDGFECSLDGGTFADCDALHELTGLFTGDHDLAVRAIDLAGNVDPSPATFGWRVLGHPETQIDSRPPNPGLSMSATFTFSSDQAGVSFECAVDDSEWAPCASPFVAGPLINLETHDFEVRAVSRFVDLEGLPITDETPAHYEWLVQVPPEPPEFDTLITSGPPAVAAGGAEALTTFAFESIPPGNLAAFECSLDGAPFSDCELPMVFEGLPAGEHEFRVRAVDLSENPDLSPASHRWEIEAAPQTALVSAPPTGIEATTATFEFTGSGAGFECSLDAGAFEPCSSPTTYSDVPYGEHEFIVRARGAAGTVDESPIVHLWETGLLTPPVAVLSGTPAASTSSRTATFTFGSTDPAAQFLCSLDGAAPTFCTSPKTYEGLVPGETHTFSVQATKPHLLIESDPATFEWTIDDVTAPETTITVAPPATTPLTDALFEFTAVEDGAEPVDFECSLDGAAYSACDSPHEVNDVAVGAHELRVRGVDAAGNVESSPASHAWEVVEVTRILTGPSDPSASPRATFTFSGMTPDAIFQCSLDGADFVACASPYEVSGLEDGEHTFEVRGSSSFGVWDVTPASHTWTVALPPGPQTSIDAAPDETTPLTDATFAFSADVAASTFECSLDGAAFAPCASGVSFSALAGGAHRFEVRAISPAEIPDASPAIHEWTVDLPPETTIDAGPPAETVDPTALFEVSSNEADATFECSLDGATFGSCTATPEFLVAAGPHELLVRAVDSFGSVDATPDRHEWIVLAFDTTIDSSPDEATEETSATFTFSSRPGATFECRLDDEPGFTPCTSPKSYSALDEGDHEFEVRARDASGYLDPTPAQFEWEIGEVPPAVTIVSGPPATTTARSASFTLSGASAYECALDAGAFAACESPKSYSGLTVGEHTFSVRARAVAPIVPAPVTTHEWTVEPLPPCTMAPVTLTASADSWIDQGGPNDNKGTDAVLKLMSKGPSNNVRALVQFSSPALTAGCEVASATLRVYASSSASGRTLEAVRLAGAWTETGVTWANQPATAGAAASVASASGTREFAVLEQVRAMYSAGAHHGFLLRDAAENQDAEQQIHAREESSNRPQLLLTFGQPDFDPPDTSIAGTPPTFTLTSTEGGSTFECSLDGAAFVACASPRTYSGLAVGEHELRVQATDAAGNTDPTPAVRTWTVVPDTTAPETTLGSGLPPASTSSTGASFPFTSNEAGTFECSLDGAAWAACASPKVYSGLALGAREFRVRAVDSAGNIDASPAVHGWTITPACQSVTVEPDRDSWVLQSSSSSNFGTDSDLKVQGKSSQNARALVRFNLPAKPAGCQVTGATLRLYANSYKENRTLQVQRLSANWTESAVTWGNQPGTSGATATAPSRTSPGWVDWAVTQQVNDMYSGSNHGFRVRDASESGGGFEQVFNSREKSENRPQLVITFG